MMSLRRRLVGRLSRSAHAARGFVRGYPYGKRVAVPVRDFARGCRYGEHIAAPALAVSPFAPDGEPNPLEEYFDSHTEGPGLWKWRHYFDIYHRHLAQFRGKPLHVVEIGIFSGGSLDMWREYFGPACQVYGVDVEPACRAYEREGVKVFIGDQADQAFWRRFVCEVPAIDVVIDDGGHEAHQQVPTLEALLPHIRPGGVYICEDIHGPFHGFHSFVDGLTRPLSDVLGPPNTLQQTLASVHRYPLITVLEKPAAPVPRFEAPRHGTQWQPFL